MYQCLTGCAHHDIAKMVSSPEKITWDKNYSWCNIVAEWIRMINSSLCIFISLISDRYLLTGNWELIQPCQLLRHLQFLATVSREEEYHSSVTHFSLSTRWGVIHTTHMWRHLALKTRNCCYWFLHLWSWIILLMQDLWVGTITNIDYAVENNTKYSSNRDRTF